jgi:hypothetical protein
MDTIQYNLDTYNKFLKYYIFINVINNIDIDINILRPDNESEIETQIKNIISMIIKTLVSIRSEIEGNNLFNNVLAVNYPIKKDEYDKIIKVEGYDKNLTTNLNNPYNRFRFMPHPSITNKKDKVEKDKVEKDKEEEDKEDKYKYKEEEDKEDIVIDDDLLYLILNFTFIDNFRDFLIISNSNSYNRIIHNRIFLFFNYFCNYFREYDFSYLNPLLQNDETENNDRLQIRKKKRTPFESGNLSYYERIDVDHKRIDDAITELNGALISYSLYYKGKDEFDYSTCQQFIEKNKNDPVYKNKDVDKNVNYKIRLCNAIKNIYNILNDDKITNIKLYKINSLYNQQYGRILESSGLKEKIVNLINDNNRKGGSSEYSRLNWLFHLQGIFVVVASAFYSTITFE